MATPAEKLMAARCRLMTREPWYGHMAMSMEWKEGEMSWIPEEKRSIGIKITSEGLIRCFFYPKWVEKKTLPELYGAIEHCINHLVRLHTLRQSSREKQVWNIATDMVVNGKEVAPRVGYKEDNGQLILPEDNMVFIPADWPDTENAEYYYERMIKEAQNPPQQGQGKGQGKGQSKGKGNGNGGGNGGGGRGQQQPGAGSGIDYDDPASCGDDNEELDDGSNTYKYHQFGGTGVDDHDIWAQSDVSEDEARQIIHERVRDATEKSQGHVPGHLTEALEALKKPVVRWREELRQYFGIHVGNRRKTFSRPERRLGVFGVKGVSHHAASKVLIIVDTSGSIGKTELEQFFGEIDAISHRADTHVLSWDAAFQGYQKYRRGDWKRLKVRGGGGTDMSAPFKWAEEHGAVGDVVILLTDGYCNWPPPRPYPTLFCITTPANQSANPEWGKIIRLKVYQ